MQTASLRRSLSTLPSSLQELALDPMYIQRYRIRDAVMPSFLAQSLSSTKGAKKERRRNASTSAFPHASEILNTPKTRRNLAVLFPGVASHYPGMGAFLLKHYKSARETWEEAEEALAGFERWRNQLDLPAVPELADLDLDSWDAWRSDRSPTQLRKIVFGGAPQSLLTKSSNAQPAILITSLAFLRVAEKELGVPLTQDYAKVLMGHSSGEITACVPAGAMTFKEAVWISRLAGLLTSRTLMTSNMESCTSDAVPERRSQMTALVINPNRTHQEVEQVVKDIWQKYGGDGAGRVEIAAYNSASQIVLSGSQAGVEHACDELYWQEIAVKATDLPVWVPFHSSFMRPAEAGVRLALNRGIELKNPTRCIASCLTGELLSTSSELANALVDQMSRPVQWTQALHNLRNKYNISEYVYIGPGKALANLARREVEKGFWEGTQGWTMASVANEQDLRQLPGLFR